MIADKKNKTLHDMKNITMEELMYWVAYYDLQRESIKDIENE